MALPTKQQMLNDLNSGRITPDQMGEKSKAIYNELVASGEYVPPEGAINNGQPLPIQNDLTVMDILTSSDPGSALVESPFAQSVNDFLVNQNLLRNKNQLNVADPYTGTSLPELALGAGETALSFITGAAGLVRAGGSGAYTLISNYLQDKNWYDNLKETTKNIEGIMGSMTYNPRTEAGKNITSVFSAPFLVYDKATSAAQDFVTSSLGGRASTTGASEDLVRQFRLAADQIQEYRDRNEEPPKSLMDRANTFRSLIAEQGGLDSSVINSPALFAGITTKSLLDFLPDMATGGSGILKKRRQIKELESAAKTLGVDLGGIPEDKLAQVAESAFNLTSGQSTIGKNVVNLSDSIKRQEEISANISAQLYKEAENAEAYYPGVQLKLLDQSMADIFKDSIFDFADLKVARGRLAQFSKITNDTAFELLDANNNLINTYVPLEKLHNFRQVLNSDLRSFRNREGYASDKEYTALLRMKNHIDEFIDAQFTADVISGNAEAIAKWKKANAWYKDYVKTFSDADAVEKIIDNDFTVEQVKNLILGNSEVVSNAAAGSIVKKLNDIFGVNSNQMEGLRKEVIFGIVTPLLEETPDVNKFVSNYNKFRRKNPTIVSELFQGDSLQNLENLVAISNAQMRLAKRTGKPINAFGNVDLDRALALVVTPFGNTQLAKGSAALRIATGIVKTARNAFRKYKPTERGLFMNEFYGTDMNTSFTNLNNIPRFAGLSAPIRVEEQQTGGERMQRLQSMVESLNEGRPSGIAPRI